MKIFKYQINGSPYRVVVQKSDEESVELEVNGTPYVVELEQKKKKTISRIQRQVPSSDQKNVAPRPTVTRPAAPAGSTSINAPLPGVILDLRVNVGDTVKKGDTLLVLEAMKMENNIQATSDGKITKVSIQKGDSVLEGAELIVIE